MKKKIYIFTILILTGLFSCKKEVYEQTQEFGTIRFNNQSGLVSLKLVYNNQPYTGLTLNNVKLPAGEGVFSFIDPATNKVLLDTALTVTANTTEELILFKPDETAALLILKNTQNEPKPAPGLMKVKIANLASKALPGNVDVVFYGFDDNLFDFVLPLDTLDNVVKQFPDEYITLKNTNSIYDPSIFVQIKDSATKQNLTEFLIPVPNNFDPNTLEPYSVFTLYLKDDESGLPVNGTNYKVSVGTLFSN